MSLSVEQVEQIDARVEQLLPLDDAENQITQFLVSKNFSFEWASDYAKRQVVLRDSEIAEATVATFQTPNTVDLRTPEQVAAIVAEPEPVRDIFAEAEIDSEAASTVLLDSALSAVARGFHVFALAERRKEPDGELSPNGFKSSTNDPATISEVWAKKPTANIGIDCGASDVCVLDFDKRDSIPEWATKLQTLKVETGKGLHVYVRGARPSKKIYVNSEHVGEIKSEGGYVVWAESIHPSGAVYRIIDDSPIAVVDSKLIDGLCQAEQKASPTLDGPPIPRGQHDNELTRIAGKLRQDGMEEQTLTAALIEVCEKRCENYGSDYKQMCEKIAHSICKKPVGENTDIALNQAASPIPGEWPEISPLDNFLSPVMPFKKEFLPNAIAPWVTDVAERMSVPLDYAGICSLEALSGVTGRRVFVYPKEHDKSWKESICISGAVVAGSGQLKTPTWKIFLNAMTEVEMDLKKDFDSKMGQYRRDMEIWEETEKQAKQALKDGNQPNRFPEPEKPVRMRLTLNDATPEKAHDVMRENPQGIFYYRDELSSWVAELDKKGHETARGLYLTATNGNDAYSVDRIGRDGGYAIMCLGIFGGFQPGLLREFLSESQNVEGGMVPRFLMLVWPDTIARRRSDRSPNKLAEGLFKQIIQTLATMKPESVQMHFSPEAQKLYWDWDDQNDKKIAALEGENSGKQSHLSKYRGALPKIAALLQLVDLMVLNGTVQAVVGNHYIDAEHMRKALTLIEYLESHMHRVYDSRLGPVQLAETRLVWRLEQGDLRDGFSAREVRRKGWGGLRDVATDLVEMALENLAEKGWVREKPSGSEPGRPTRRWDINPKLKTLPTE